MDDNFIKKALEGALVAVVELGIKEDELREQLDNLLREQSKAIVKLISLVALTDDLPQQHFVTSLARKLTKAGMTDAVRAVLRSSDDWMTPTQIRDQLIRLHFDFDRYQNPLALIHTVLGRLSDPEKGGELESRTEEGKTAYRVKPRKRRFDFTELIEGFPPNEAKELLSKTAASIINDPKFKMPKKGKKLRND